MNTLLTSFENTHAVVQFRESRGNERLRKLNHFREHTQMHRKDIIRDGAIQESGDQLFFCWFSIGNPIDAITLCHQLVLSTKVHHYHERSTFNFSHSSHKIIARWNRNCVFLESLYHEDFINLIQLHENVTCTKKSILQWDGSKQLIHSNPFGYVIIKTTEVLEASKYL